MSGRCLLGVDIGTYSSKGVLVRESGEIVAESMVEHALDIPAPGYAEHDAEKVWWHDFVVITADLLARSGISPGAILSIGVSTISPAVVPVGAGGRALRPAILYGIDTRATAEMADLARATGAQVSSQSAAPKVMWIRRNEPEVWARTRWILNGSGYLAFRLTGTRTIDFYDASIFFPFFDIAAGAWKKDMADLVAPAAMMPEPSWTGRVTGAVTREAARETGLAEGTPVVTGTADAASEAVASGLAYPGDMMLMYGSSTFFILKTERLVSARAYWASPFTEEGSWIVAGGTATAGSLTRWFRDNFADAERAAERNGGPNAYAALSVLASASPPGARGLIALPYFSGERQPLHDPDARGMLFGLTLGHGRADVYRALLESVGFSIRHNIDALAAEGCRATRVLAVGGGTRNAAWMQIVSDIAGIEQVMPAGPSGASYGDAFLAGIGAGLFGGIAETGRWVKPGETVRPDPARRAGYDAAYAIYRELYERTAGLMKKTGAMVRSHRA